MYFTVFNLLSDCPIPENLVTVRLMTRRYVSALVAHGEREMIIAGLWALTGFHQVPVGVTKHRRSVTTYSLKHKVSVLVNAITSFSARPLEFIFYLGLTIGGLASMAAAYLIVRRLFFGVMLPGWPSLVVSVWLLGGLILACLGVIGIYLSKIFIETKQRPYTIVRHVYERTAEETLSNDSRDDRALLR
jgi:putative glycosyltransferase